MRKLFSIATTSIFLFCALPEDGFCSLDDSSEMQERVYNFLDQLENDADEEAFLREFDRLEAEIDSTENPITTGRKFLEALLEELNARFGVAFTLPEICQIVRENMDDLEIPLEERGELLQAIDLIEADFRAEVSLDPEVEQARTEENSRWSVE